MDSTLLNRRAAIFVSSMQPLDDNILATYIKTFEPLKMYPSVNKGFGLKITPNGLIQEEINTLDLKYLDESVKITIGANRFDIVSTKSDEDINAFLLRVNEIKTKIKSIVNTEITRLALCATVTYSMDTKKNVEIYHKLSSQDDSPVEWLTRKVIRTDIEDKEKNIKLNNVYTISVNEPQLPNIYNLVLDIDINTHINNNVESINQLETSFWSYASGSITNAIKDYSDLFE